jgi:putative SOS response-associated peptidase YedK
MSGSASTGRPSNAFAVALKSGEPCALAGLWERWQPQEGPALETFTILTTDPNELMEPIHNRMPVILAPRLRRWLDSSGLNSGGRAQPPVDLMRPYPAEMMAAWPVSARVGNVRNNDPQLLDEVQIPLSQTLFPID